jgi:hypothetical protein
VGVGTDVAVYRRMVPARHVGILPESVETFVIGDSGWRISHRFVD